MGCDKSYLLRFPCGNILTLERPYLIDGRKTIPTLTSFELFNKRRQYLKIFSKHQQLNLQTLKAHEILESRILPIDCPFLNLVEKLPSTITRDSPSVDLINTYWFYLKDLDNESLKIVADHKIA